MTMFVGPCAGAVYTRTEVIEHLCDGHRTQYWRINRAQSALHREHRFAIPALPAGTRFAKAPIRQGIPTARVRPPQDSRALSDGSANTTWFITSATHR